MATNYLRDPETVKVENGARSVKTMKSAIIDLIGTAPIRDVNTLVQCLSEKDITAFSSQLIGFATPQVLGAIYGHGAGTVLVVSVLDPAKYKAATEDEVVTSGKSIEQARLAHLAVANVAVKNNEGSTTHTTNADYRADTRAGVFTNLGKAIEAGGNVKMSYECADPSKVTAADIIGRVNSVGNRTDMKLLNGSFNLYGYFVKILIALMFCTQKSVAIELIAMAKELGAVTYIDAPVGTTLTQTLAGRDSEGTINFSTSSDHIRLCYPHVKVYDLMTNIERLEPLNQRIAGLRAGVDLNKGYQWLPSNQEILKITGVERQLSAIIDDPQGEVDPLGEQGITTIFSSYGSGLRPWGGRTAA